MWTTSALRQPPRRLPRRAPSQKLSLITGGCSTPCTGRSTRCSLGPPRRGAPRLSFRRPPKTNHSASTAPRTPGLAPRRSGSTSRHYCRPSPKTCSGPPRARVHPFRIHPLQPVLESVHFRRPQAQRGIVNIQLPPTRGDSHRRGGNLEKGERRIARGFPARCSIIRASAFARLHAALGARLLDPLLIG